jgi:hypothetical protein
MRPKSAFEGWVQKHHGLYMLGVFVVLPLVVIIISVVLSPKAPPPTREPTFEEVKANCSGCVCSSYGKETTHRCIERGQWCGSDKCK